jgi:hypothetical protein
METVQILEDVDGTVEKESQTFDEELMEDTLPEETYQDVEYLDMDMIDIESGICFRSTV